MWDIRFLAVAYLWTLWTMSMPPSNLHLGILFSDTSNSSKKKMLLLS